MAVISSPKPHILIIPGAWHPASTMEDFRKSLEAAGFPTLIVPTPSVGNRDVTVRDDEAQTTALLKPLIEDGKEVAVLGHSYGGVVLTGVTGATVGLDKRSRDAQGLKGGILGMIFLAAFIPLPDETMWEMASKKWYPFVASEKVETEGFTYAKDAKETFYNDCSDEVAERAVASLKGHSATAVFTAPSATGWKEKAYDGRRGYIRCLQDQALPIKAQDYFIARTEVEWVVRTLDASHSPFLSMPDELTGVVAEMAVEFAKN